VAEKTGQGGAISAVPVCELGAGLSFVSPPVSVSMAHANRFLAVCKCMFVTYLMPQHVLFSVLRKSALPSGLAPSANFKNVSLALAAGHCGLQKCIRVAFSYA